MAVIQGVRGRQTSRAHALGEAHAKAKEPMRGWRTPEKARQEIIDAGRAYLSKHGFKDLTIDKLMRSTKIGRSAFYAYFGSIYELAAVFIHELSAHLETASAEWFADNGDSIAAIRSTLSGAVAFWEANGRMIRALEEASWQDDRLRAVWRDEIGMAPVRRLTEAIKRDQAKGLIGQVDAREMSVALNRFNMTYLNDRFGNPRRKSKDSDKAKVLETLERVWLGTLYGKLAEPNKVEEPKVTTGR